MQAQLDEMLDGLVDEIEQSADRAGELKAELHEAVQTQMHDVNEQIDHARARVDDIQYAQQVAQQDLGAVDDRCRKLMDVLEQEVEAREAGVDRLSESLAHLEAKVADNLDDVREAAATAQTDAVRREGELRSDMDSWITELKAGQQQVAQDIDELGNNLDEVAGAVAELASVTDLEDLEAKLDARMSNSEGTVQTAQSTADTALAEAQAVRMEVKAATEDRVGLIAHMDDIEARM
eukprot:scaffold283607_cov39-Prasinocladus_malaysianus.AAC.1